MFVLRPRGWFGKEIFILAFSKILVAGCSVLGHGVLIGILRNLVKSFIRKIC